MPVFVNPMDFGTQTLLNLLIGVGLVLLNLLFRYFFSVVPHVISVLRWENKRRAFLLTYLIALLLQIATSPIFKSPFQSIYIELAWSPYQALLNVLGIIIVDLAIRIWQGLRSGAEAGRMHIETVKEQAKDRIESVGAQVGLTEEGREAQEARLKAKQDAEAQSTADRKQRLDDRLGDY